MATNQKRPGTWDWDTVWISLGGMFRDAMKYGSRVGIAMCGAAVLISWAGQETAASIWVNISTNVGKLGGAPAPEATGSWVWAFVREVIPHVIPWGITGLFGTGWWLHRRLYHTNVARLGGRIGELERLLDDKRSTSGLLEDGTTPPDSHRH